MIQYIHEQVDIYQPFMRLSTHIQHYLGDILTDKVPVSPASVTYARRDKKKAGCRLMPNNRPLVFDEATSDL